MANYVDSANEYRKAVGQLLAAYENIIGIDGEYILSDLGNKVSDADFPDITKAEFTSGVGSAQTVIGIINTHGTNLYRVSDGSHR